MKIKIIILPDEDKVLLFCVFRSVVLQGGILSKISVKENKESMPNINWKFVK